MNKYIDEVYEILDKSDIHPEYRSFINNTLQNLAITRNADHLNYILGTPREFTNKLIENNKVYQPLDNECVDSNDSTIEPNSNLDNNFENEDITNFETNANIVDKDQKSRKLPKGAFHHTYNISIMLIYKIIVVMLIIGSLIGAAILALIYHSYEVNTSIIASFFAFLALLALIGLTLEQIRNVINSLLHRGHNLLSYIVKLVICSALALGTYQLFRLCLIALINHLPLSETLSKLEPITNFILNIK